MEIVEISKDRPGYCKTKVYSFTVFNLFKLTLTLAGRGMEISKVQRGMDKTLWKPYICGLC